MDANNITKIPTMSMGVNTNAPMPVAIIKPVFILKVNSFVGSIFVIINLQIGFISR